MLRSNSKKATNNIKKYIIDNTDFSGYTLSDCFFANLEDIKEGAGLEIFPEIAKGLYDIFYIEYLKNNNSRVRYSIQQLFSDWCSGLPTALDTSYYYSCDPIDILANILEMTQEEKENYSKKHQDDLKNCQYLDYLIFREITKIYNK